MSTDRTETDEIVALIRDSAAGWVASAGTVAHAHRQWTGAGEAEGDTWAAMAELGWPGLFAPEAAGGGGLGLVEARALHEVLGAGLVSAPLAMGAHLPILAARASAGPAAVGLVEAIVGGAGPCAVLWQSRPGALSAEETGLTATPQGGRIRLDGTAAHVVGSEGAATFLVAARAAEGVGLYRVGAEAAGLQISRQRTAEGGSLARVVLSGVTVDATDVVAPAGTGAAALDGALDAARLLLSAELLGLMRSVQAKTLDYLRTRRQFGRAIGSFQALQHRAVDLHVQIELSDAALTRAIRLFGETTDPVARAAAASAAKAQTSEAALLVTREAVQLHGAIAYTQEHDVGLHLDRALVLAALLGNAAAHRRRYGLAVSRQLAA